MLPVTVGLELPLVGVTALGRLEGKVALITGTAGGQGRAAALRFAQEGAKVVGCDIKVDEAAETVALVTAAGGEMISLQPGDMSDGPTVRRWIDWAVETHGGFDILYNNAGRAEFGPIEALTYEQFAFTLRNELDLIYWPCRYAWEHLKARGGGVIINTASSACLVGIDGLGNFAHGAAKGGVIALTKQLAVEGARHGIRAVSISPGVVESPCTYDVLQEPGVREWYLTMIPLGRLGQPEDIANAALFLASDEASWITGNNLVIDGGITRH